MSLQIITDSASDIPRSKQQEWGITILPLQVFFGEESYVDGVTLSNEEFYQKLSVAEQLPKTSQVMPSAFEDVFSKFLEQGDEILCIHLAAELSGTLQSAFIARNKFPDAPITIFDSQTVTLAQNLLVQLAVKLRDEGKSVQEIVAALEKAKDRVRLYAIVDDIKYLKMGGRLSGTGAFLANVLDIKPLVMVKEGKVTSFGKARGLARAYQAVVEETLKTGIDPTLPYAFIYSQTPERAAALETAFDERLPGKAAFHAPVGTVVGTHAGPGCVGIAFFLPEK